MPGWSRGSAGSAASEEPERGAAQSGLSDRLKALVEGHEQRLQAMETAPGEPGRAGARASPSILKKEFTERKKKKQEMGVWVFSGTTRKFTDCKF